MDNEEQAQPKKPLTEEERASLAAEPHAPQDGVEEEAPTVEELLNSPLGVALRDEVANQLAQHSDKIEADIAAKTEGFVSKEEMDTLAGKVEGILKTGLSDEQRAAIEGEVNSMVVAACTKTLSEFVTRFNALETKFKQLHL